MQSTKASSENNKLLIQLDGKVQALKESMDTKVGAVKDTIVELKIDIKELKDNLSHRVDTLENVKLDKSDFEKFLIENLRPQLATVEGLKTRNAIQIGAIAIISAIVIPLVIYIYKSDNNIDAQIEQGVRNVLSEYNIDLK